MKKIILKSNLKYDKRSMIKVVGASMQNYCNCLKLLEEKKITKI